MRRLICLASAAALAASALTSTLVPASELGNEYDGEHEYRCVFDMYRRVNGAYEWRRGIPKSMRADSDSEAYTKVIKWFREKSPHQGQGWSIETAMCTDTAKLH